MKIKVLIINKYLYHTGGIEEFVRSFLSIDDRELKLRFLACSSQESKKFIHTKDSRVSIYKTNFTLFNTPISLTFFIGLFRVYFSSDIIHINTPFPTVEIVLFFLSLIKKKKIIVTYHSSIVKQKKVLFFIQPFLKGLLKRSSVICVTSPFLKNKSFLKEHSKKIQIIPIGQQDYGCQFVKDYYDNNYALFVGRLVYYKGIFVLLESIKNYMGTLKIVGEGPLLEEITQYIKKNNLSCKVELLGFVSDEELQEIYKKASFLVFPSIAPTEAFGIVQIQAMSFGLPIINTNLPTGVPWVARANQEAITIPVGDSRALEDAMNQLVSSVELRKKLGIQGRKRFLDLFTEEVMLDSYKKLYRCLFMSKNNLNSFKDDSKI